MPSAIVPLPGFKPAKSMVYAGLYPVSADEFEQLNEAILKLTLNDASVRHGRRVQRQSIMTQHELRFLQILLLSSYLSKNVNT